MNKKTTIDKLCKAIMPDDKQNPVCIFTGVECGYKQKTNCEDYLRHIQHREYQQQMYGKV